MHKVTNVPQGLGKGNLACTMESAAQNSQDSCWIVLVFTNVINPPEIVRSRIALAFATFPSHASSSVPCPARLLWLLDPFVFGDVKDSLAAEDSTDLRRPGTRVILIEIETLNLYGEWLFAVVGGDGGTTCPRMMGRYPVVVGDIGS